VPSNRCDKGRPLRSRRLFRRRHLREIPQRAGLAGISRPSAPRNPVVAGECDRPKRTVPASGHLSLQPRTMISGGLPIRRSSANSPGHQTWCCPSASEVRCRRPARQLLPCVNQLGRSFPAGVEVCGARRAVPKPSNVRANPRDHSAVLCRATATYSRLVSQRATLVRLSHRDRQRPIGSVLPRGPR